MPLLVVAATGDPLLRITPVAPPRRIGSVPQPSVQEAVDTWRGLDDCSGTPVTRVTGAQTSTGWATCRGGSRVQYDLYRGGAHVWPAGSSPTPGALTEIWAFARD